MHLCTGIEQLIGIGFRSDRKLTLSNDYNLVAFEVDGLDRLYTGSHLDHRFGEDGSDASDSDCSVNDKPMTAAVQAENASMNVDIGIPIIRNNPSDSKEEVCSDRNMTPTLKTKSDKKLEKPQLAQAMSKAKRQKQATAERKTSAVAVKRKAGRMEQCLNSVNELTGADDDSGGNNHKDSSGKKNSINHECPRMEKPDSLKNKRNKKQKKKKQKHRN